MQRARTINRPTFLRKYFPLKISVWNFDFHETLYQYKASADDVQTKNHNLTYIFQESMPFENFSFEIVSSQ